VFWRPGRNPNDIKLLVGTINAAKWVSKPQRVYRHLYVTVLKCSAPLEATQNKGCSYLKSNTAV
jgi:hypothetical protein